MVGQSWERDSRRMLICVDSYQKGVPRGRLYNARLEAETFESLSQLILQVETMLDALQMPQSYTAVRTFSSVMKQMQSSPSPSDVRKGTKATFELQVIFRQHTSWQGVVLWREEQAEQSFRSVLELIVLMDSALRRKEERDGP